MDNISQENNQENGQDDISPKISGVAEDSDIQFEEVIDIDKIQLPWEGKIEFIPGNRYELVQLL